MHVCMYVCMYVCIHVQVMNHILKKVKSEGEQLLLVRTQITSKQEKESLEQNIVHLNKGQ